VEKIMTTVTKDQLKEAFSAAAGRGLIATAPGHLAEVVWDILNVQDIAAGTPDLSVFMTDAEKSLEHDVSVLDYAIAIIKARLGSSSTVPVQDAITDTKERLRKEGMPAARQKKADKLLAQAQSDMRTGAKGMGRSRLASLAESIDEGGPFPTEWKDRLSGS
jgi:hypothetical protein